MIGHRMSRSRYAFMPLAPRLVLPRATSPISPAPEPFAAMYRRVT
jgi:hypothetical protein